MRNLGISLATSARRRHTGKRNDAKIQQRLILAEFLEARRLLTTFTVTSLADSGTGSLRDAISAANGSPGPDEIHFATPPGGTIALTSGEIVITDSLTMNGPGSLLLTVSGSNSSRLFNIIGGA